MASITIAGGRLDYPIYDLNDKSLKRLLLKAGKAGNHPVITALHDFNLSIRSGERIGLYGPNGSGKTSLLRSIAGIYPLSEGTLTVDGAMTPLLGLAIGVNTEISAEDNIRLLLRIDGIRPTRELIDAVWAFTELEDTMRLMPLRTFSSGMMMRVLFSVSTAFSPDILLLDEWLSVVDETFAKKAEQRMHDLVSRSSIMVIASHNMQLLQRVCTRIIRLEHGRIISDTPVTPAEVAQPTESAAARPVAEQAIA